MALITWAETSVTVDVGDTVTVDFTYGREYGEYFDTRITTSDTGVATITTSGQYSQFGGTATITGVSAGTATVVPGPRDTQNTPLTITVTTPAEDDKFLNKRGLTHFWENIDEIKQDKLTAGTNITIAADNTISASQPTVNDATLTIQRNGTNVQTFTANASSNVTANISVPTKTSDLVNDGSDNTVQYLETDETAYKTASIPYGECDSTSTATEFTATVPGITELRDGVCMLLKNGVVTSASGFTININGLGAKPVYNNMAAATRETTVFNVNYTILFVYDSDRVSGGCWVYYRGYYSDSNSIGYQIRTNSSSLPAKQTGYRYRLWLTSADGQNYVPINTATGTSTTSTKALNTTTPIDPFGAIVYNSTNGTVEAGANLPNATQWTQYTLDLRYAKYPLATLTYPDPVYLQCTPQSTGGALINDIVQALPTTEDGKIYIYLGSAYSTVSMELKQNHPVYYFKDGAIRQWTNAAAGISSVAWGDITGTLSNQTDLNTALGAKANSADLATVATSGSYNDLSNKPTVPEIKRRTNATTTIDISPLYVAGDGTTTYPMALKTHGDDRAGSFAYININEPTSSITEAYAGGYVWDMDEDWWRKMNEVRLALYSDIPTVPTVNNATLTIQKNGTTVNTFTANASSNVTANITVPTATSDLTNDSGFIDEVSTITNARIDEIMGVA